MNVLTNKELTAKIVVLAKAERITKKALSELSRELLAAYVDNGDVSCINQLLGSTAINKKDIAQFTLTPMNFRLAVQYFRSFIPHNCNWDEVKEYALKGKGKRVEMEFGKFSKNANKRIKANHEAESAKDAIVEWLDDDTHDIWAWSSNIEVAEVEKNYSGMITNAIKKGMDEEKGGSLSVTDVTMAIMEAGITGSDLILALEEMKDQVLNAA